MRPPDRQPSSRLRVERPEEPELTEDDSSTWAVSYSDLLMVLMSFFVMFFQFTPDKTQTIIEQLAISVGDKVGDQGKGPGTGKKDEPTVQALAAKAAPPTVEEKLIDSFKQTELDVAVDKQSNTLTILLPDNIYGPRGFKVNDQTRQILTEVMARIRPFSEELDVYFVGHADADPVSKGNQYLSDNFSLSALRATHALQFALAQGFPKTHLFAQGGAENVRNSRTLSVKVKPRSTVGE